MQASHEPQSNTNATSGTRTLELKRSFRLTSTADARAMLSDLSLRPLSQREFLCRLLKRAAAQAATKDSVVGPVESHHEPTP